MTPPLPILRIIDWDDRARVVRTWADLAAATDTRYKAVAVRRSETEADMYQDATITGWSWNEPTIEARRVQHYRVGYNMDPEAFENLWR